MFGEKIVKLTVTGRKPTEFYSDYNSSSKTVEFYFITPEGATHHYEMTAAQFRDFINWAISGFR